MRYGFCFILCANFVVPGHGGKGLQILLGIRVFSVREVAHTNKKILLSLSLLHAHTHRQKDLAHPPAIELKLCSFSHGHSTLAILVCVLFHASREKYSNTGRWQRAWSFGLGWVRSVLFLRFVCCFVLGSQDQKTEPSRGTCMRVSVCVYMSAMLQPLCCRRFNRPFWDRLFS